MRFILLLILIGCSQHSNRLVTGDNRSGGGTTPPGCSTPSPLCPDITKDEDSRKEGDEEEESAKQPETYPSPSPSPSSVNIAPIDYFGGLANQFKLNVSRASIPKNKEVKLTLTVSAIHDLRLKSIDSKTGLRRTYNLWIAARKASSTSKLPDTYKLDSTSTNEYFLGSKKPKCDITKEIASYRCELKITQMDKDDSFTVTLKVKASEDFNIGFAKKCADEECKEREPLTIEVN